MILDIIKHFIFFNLFKYWRFSAGTDEHHLLKTQQILKQHYYNERGLIKEINIFGLRSKKICIKSTAYYFDIMSKNGSKVPLSVDFATQIFSYHKIKNQNELFNLCVLYLATKKTDYHSLNEEIKRIINSSKNKIEITSLHIFLLKLRFEYYNSEIDGNELVWKTLDKINHLSIKEIMSSNSFLKNRASTSHEFGYFLNVLFDIYEDTNDCTILEVLNDYTEKLHRLFISHKTIYSSVIKKDVSMSLSGIFLISKLFLRYTLLTKDYRFASAAFYMLDIGMYIQEKNIKGYVSNTFPIYRYGSPMKYPSWTLCYFLDSLFLKDKVKKTLLNETCLSF